MTCPGAGAAFFAGIVICLVCILLYGWITRHG
jgi:hypothetical protein